MTASGFNSAAAWPWKVCGFLFLATALSYLDRQALSVAAPLVSRELGLDNRQLGLLLSAFFYTYALMHLCVGYFLDRYNIRLVYGFFVGAWSLAQVAGGLSRGFGELFAARLFLGAFEAAGQVGAARIIARIVPGPDRGFANGIMMSGGSIGAVIAPFLVLGLSASIGWRGAFAVLGAIGLVWTAAWLIWFRPAAPVLYGQPSEVKLNWRVILAKPQFWACVGAAAFGVPIIHIASSWLPTFLVQQWKLKVGSGLSGYLFLIYLGLDLGFVGGGWLIRRMVRRGQGLMRARRRVLLLAAALMLSVVAVPFATDVRLAVAGILLLNMGRACWGAIFLTYNQEIAPGRVGMVAGIMGSIGAFAGAILVWTIGIVSERAGFDPAFFGLGLLVVLGTVPLLVVKWEEPHEA